MKLKMIACVVLGMSVFQFAESATLRSQNDGSNKEVQKQSLSERSFSNGMHKLHLERSLAQKGPPRRRRRAPAPPPRRRRNPCLQCAAGTKCQNGGCYACGGGWFQPSPHQSYCNQCNAGTYNQYSQGTSCSGCPGGRWSAAGWSSCKDHRSCGAGSFVSRAGSTTYDRSCQTCGAGKFSTSANAGSCADCPVGKSQSAAGQTMCTACPDGTGTSSPGSAGCGTCTAGKFAGSAQASCTDCPAGQFSGSGAHGCTSCVAGRYAPSGGAASCEACPAGKWSSAGATTCEPCSLGHFSAEGASACTVCAEGRFAGSTETQNDCPACAAGKYAGTTGAHQCQDAPPGHFVSAEGASTYQQCQAGEYQNEDGATKCIACPEGKWAGQDGADECQPHTQCGTGKEIAMHGQGTATTDTECKLCDPGSFSDSTEQCKLCEVGFAQSAEGAASCYECGEGVQVNKEEKGATGCSKCEVGKASPDTGTCVDCDIGTFAEKEGQDQCNACTAGKFANNTGASHCASCPVGTTSEVAGVSACRLCQAGRYMSFVGSFLPTCNDCDENTYADLQGSTHCQACPAGKHQPTLGRWDCVMDISTTAAPFTNDQAATCTDLPFQDGNGNACSSYAAEGYCTKDGDYGKSWPQHWGTFSDVGVNGVDALKACCACGGGEVKAAHAPSKPPACTDEQWADSEGKGCGAYATSQYCTHDGGYGAGWSKATMGTFGDRQADGIDATQACCACGGGMKANFPCPHWLKDADLSNFASQSNPPCATR